MPTERSWLVRYTGGRFFSLLLSIVLLLLVQPFLQGGGLGRMGLRILFFVTLGTALYSISDHKRRAVVGLVLVLSAVAVIGTSYFVAGEALLASGLLVNLIFLVFIAVNVLRHLLSPGEVTAEKIYAALCVYLLLGLLWACGYAALELLRPGSLQVEGVDLAARFGEREQMFSQCLYYSFVTLTTLGYGDVRPATPPAQSLAYVEALTGQLYLAVLVARLVALHIASAGNGERK